MAVTEIYALLIGIPAVSAWQDGFGSLGAQVCSQVELKTVNWYIQLERMGIRFGSEFNYKALRSTRPQHLPACTLPHNHARTLLATVIITPGSLASS